jgi:hypothetical protein
MEGNRTIVEFQVDIKREHQERIVRNLKPGVTLEIVPVEAGE